MRQETTIPQAKDAPPAYSKIDGRNGGSYASGHNAALSREQTLKDQRPYLKEHNTGAGGPANGKPERGIIIKR